MSTLPGLQVDVKVGQVVVKVAVLVRAEVAAEERGVRGKHSRHCQAPHAAQNEAHAGQPLVEVGNDIARALELVDVLWGGRGERRKR